jgi:hypothetical protein
MAINKLSIQDVLIDNVPCAPPAEDAPHTEPIGSQQTYPTCTLIQPGQRLIGRDLEWIIHGGMSVATQLDCTNSIESTQNNHVHAIYLGQYMTFTGLSVV